MEQLYGLETMRGAADQLKKLYGGKGKMRLKLFISVKGIKLYNHQTMVSSNAHQTLCYWAILSWQDHFATVKISSVSFCTLDPKNKKLFAFINRKKRRNFCHVFQCNEHDVGQLLWHTHALSLSLSLSFTHSQAQKMVETMAEAFEVTFKQLEQKREKRKVGNKNKSHIHTMELCCLYIDGEIQRGKTEAAQ